MRIFLIVLLFLGSQVSILAQQLQQIESLQGSWNFSVGDDMSWRLPSHDFSGWDKIYIQNSWESQGYEGYNGYAWYKRKVEIPDVSPKDKIILKLNRIDDADEVYFNGTLIGKTGNFLPNPVSAYSEERHYEIPVSLINQTGANLIAVRVYDLYYEGGILGSVGLYKDATARYFLKDLSGNWKFKAGNNDSYKGFEYDDRNWEVLRVPGKWETQGYRFLNGYAWYRKTFNWDRSTSGGDVVVVLGRIDDKDISYLNGQRIGSVDEMRRGSYFADKEDYQTLRAYRIPSSKLNSGKNVLAIRVWDDRYDGGIYEGPVGIMSVEAFDNYFSEYEKSKNIFEHFLDNILD
ncbi:beta galactosidase jelly roll domain-containing protein [Saccharicrinis sp. 156]|uniref:beta galactosidase jelly roll domain-containing protein n=1 Tax=Saccharicrinis sp. 156 TaxID=3417574 RepID=UPI003D34243A